MQRLTQGFTDGLLSLFPARANALGAALGIQAERIQVSAEKYGDTCKLFRMKPVQPKPCRPGQTAELSCSARDKGGKTWGYDYGAFGEKQDCLQPWSATDAVGLATLAKLQVQLQTIPSCELHFPAVVAAGSILSGHAEPCAESHEP